MAKRCGQCQGPLILLGKLGLVKHYRCRDCGIGYSSQPKKVVRGSFGEIKRVVY